MAPAVLLPAGALGRTIDPAPQANLDFDIGINPAWSVIFGAGYSDHSNRLQQDARLLLAPAWMGFKSKHQFGQDTELFWDLAAEMVYAKEYWRGSGNGSLETMDGAGVAGAGFDLWLTSSLLLGVETKAHLVIEGSDVFPLVQLGLRLGLRG